MSAPVLVVAPFSGLSARGNRTTAARIAMRLREVGEDVTLTSIDELDALDLQRFRTPDAVWIGVHVAHFGTALERAGIAPSAPRAARPGLLLVIGGNDVYELLGTDRQGAPYAAPTPLASAALLHAVDSIAVASEHQREAVQAHAPRATVTFVPRYPDVGYAALPIERERLAAFLGTAAGRARVLAWCGAFRPVKRPEWIAPILRGVRANVPDARLLLAGPTPAPGDPIEAELAALDHVLRIPPFPAGRHGAIGTLLLHTDVALNTSISEGTANFLLEAMHESVAVVASDCPGTRSWADGHALLFHTIEAAVAGITRLLTKPVERATFAHAGANLVREQASPERERAALAQALAAARERPGR